MYYYYYCCCYYYYYYYYYVKKEILFGWNLGVGFGRIPAASRAAIGVRNGEELGQELLEPSAHNPMKAEPE